MKINDPLKLNILVVEDEPTLALLERAELEGKGHVVKIAETGATAREIIARGGVDVVMLDHKLPDVVDLELLEIFVTKYPHVPVVVVTGRGDERRVVEVLKAGASEYVTKDFDAQFLKSLPGVAARVYRQKRLEEEKAKLIRENTRLATVIKHIAECILVTDADGVIEYINTAGEELSGYSLAELRGLTPSVLKSGLHEPAYYESLWKTIKAGQVWRGRITNRKKDGTLWEEDVTISPVADFEGKIVNFVAIMRDVTRESTLESARGEAVAALQANERFLRMLNECNTALLHISDETVLLKNICSIAVNTGGYRMAWVGIKMSDEEKSVYPASYSGFEDGYLENLKISWADTDRGRGPTGTCIRTGDIVIAHDFTTNPLMRPWREEAIRRGYASSISLPLRNASEIIGALMIYSDKPKAFDSDEVKVLTNLAENLAYGLADLQAKKARDEAVKNLENSRAMLRLVADSLPAMIGYVNRERMFVFANNQLAQSYGISVKQIVGKAIWEVQGEEVYGRVREAVDRTFGGEAVNYELTRVFHKEGERHLNVQHSPHFGPGGVVIGMFILAVDVTEQKMARQKAEQNRQEMLLADKMRSLGLLTSSVAHEVGNPLNYMFMYASLGEKIWRDVKEALLNHPTPPQYAGGLPFGDALVGMEKMVASLNDGSKRISDIVSRLKKFSRPSKGKRQAMDLNAAVKYSVELTGALIQGHAGNLVMKLQDSLPPLEGNSSEIEQVIVNIISNACHAMGKRPGTLTITTSFSKEAGVVQLTIADEGEGIPPENIARLGEPFFTTRGDSSGTGLGLMVSNEIMKEHGGSIRLVSEGVGKGATAVMEFPALKGGHGVV